MTPGPPTSERPHYVWPRYVIAVVVLGLAIAVVWTVRETQKLKRYRDSGQAPGQTNSAPAR
jgi:heme exporter protein D